MIQYRHKPEDRRTYAVQTPQEEDLDQAVVDLMTMGSSNKISMYTGIARVHPLDNFDRRMGRQTSEENMEEGFFNLITFKLDTETAYYGLTDGTHLFMFKKKHGTPNYLLVDVFT